MIRLEQLIEAIDARHGSLLRKTTMNDLTIIFLTVNRVPKEWAKFHRTELEKAIGDSPVISISREPIDFGTNLIQTEKESMSNIWFQLLRGAKLATTKYIAVAEDDTLYPEEHFSLRPPDNTVGYNLSRWVVNIERRKPHYYYYHPRAINASLIGPRDLIIKTLDERYKNHPNGTPERYTGEIGRSGIERLLGVEPVQKTSLYTNIPIIQIKHNYRRPELSDVRGVSPKDNRSYDLPHWGNVENIINKFI